MGTLRVDNIKNVEGSNGPIIEGPSEFETTSHLNPPNGTTAQRSSAAVTGSLRFNNETSRLEYYDGVRWVEVDIKSSVDRGVFGAGLVTPTYNNTISYVTISSTGNATDFGDLITQSQRKIGNSSSVRGIFAGGYSNVPASPAGFNTIEYVTIASTGDAIDFGDLVTSTRDTGGGMSSQTRGVFVAAFNSPSNYMNYITMASAGNALNFGDLSVARGRVSAASSPTRGFIVGGVNSNVIDYITISTTGNATDFGDSTRISWHGAACSSSVRLLNGGGTFTNVYNTIEYLTISTLGNALTFGDLTEGRRILSATSNSIRGLWMDGLNPSSATVNTIDYVTIMSTGNATDFGDLTTIGFGGFAVSDCHGGL